MRLRRGRDEMLYSMRCVVLDEMVVLHRVKLEEEQ